MYNFIDKFLNGITMYRLVLYYLCALIAIAAGFGAFGMLPFHPLDLLISTAIIVFICWVANNAFAKTFGVPANVESIYITGLILALIISPIKPSQYLSLAGLPFLIWVSVWAMASKYIFAIRKKHIFNPAAFAVALTALTIGQSASWWVGTLAMLPFVLLGGFLMAWKLLRVDRLVVSFLLVALVVILGIGISKGINPLVSLQKALVETPILFFAFIMLTEPLTSPPTEKRKILYGAFVALLFSPAIHIGSLYSTPELALLAGNLFSYLLSPKEKYIMRLKEKIQLAPDIYDFIFRPDRRMKFTPGQYLEWTLGHSPSDSRGNRRYFTVASSPREHDVRLGIRFYDKSSSFKIAMLSMDPGEEIVASQCSGDFTLPKDKRRKLAFIAGGIGITPIRSMIKDLLEKNERRNLALFYSNRDASEIVYSDVFGEAQTRLGIKTVYTLTGVNDVPSDWRGYRGRIDARMITKEIPDYRERLFYLSGPRSLVTGFEDTLRDMGISEKQIKTDFFPGF